MNKTRAWIIAAVATVLTALAPPLRSSPRRHRVASGGDLSRQLGADHREPDGRAGCTNDRAPDRLGAGGTITGQNGSVDYNGTLKGAAVAFDFTINVQGTDLKLDYTGTVEGDTMQGQGGVRPVRRRHVHGQASVTHCPRRRARPAAARSSSVRTRGQLG